MRPSRACSHVRYAFLTRASRRRGFSGSLWSIISRSFDKPEAPEASQPHISFSQSRATTLQQGKATNTQRPTDITI